MLGLILKLILQGFRITLEVGSENVPVKSYGAFKKVTSSAKNRLFTSSEPLIVEKSFCTQFSSEKTDFRDISCCFLSI